MKFNGKKWHKFHDDGHKSEQITILLKGKFSFYVGNEKRIMKKWDVVFIEPYEKHGGEALSDVEGIDVFFPKRTEPKNILSMSFTIVILIFPDYSLNILRESNYF